MYETGIYRRAGHLAQKHTFSREFVYFSREDDFLTSSAHFFQRFFHRKAYMPTQNRTEDRWLSRLLQSQAYIKPTRCLHQPTWFWRFTAW